jgi:large subunit ribosomal protein L10
MEARAAQYKKDIVAKFSRLMKEYKIIGVVNMENLPAPQLQQIRAQLRKDVLFFMGKRKLIELAIDDVKDSRKDIEQLKNYLGGMPALLFTNQDPFKIAGLLRKSKSNAPAKSGQTAPRDLIISAGPTPFSPGPIISELSQAGIKTGIEGGKVSVKADVVLVKDGEKVTQQTANILAKFGVEPMEIGIDLVAVYEDGVIYKKDVLSIDEAQFVEDLKVAGASALYLALNIAYIAKDTVDKLIAKAFNEAKTLSLKMDFLTSDTVKELLAKAVLSGNALEEKMK